LPDRLGDGEECAPSSGRPSCVRLEGACVALGSVGLDGVAAGLGERVELGGGAVSGGKPSCERLAGAGAALEGV